MQDAKLSVYYDGACPICTREIDFYRRRTDAESVAWIDVSRCDAAEVRPGLTRGQALARFHVAAADGRLISGGPAFAALWSVVPGFRWLGLLFRSRPAAAALEGAYRVALIVRPRLQKLFGAGTTCPLGAIPAWLVRELRSDHAGETGAVCIYRGVLAVTRDPKVRDFAEAHLRTEQNHLDLIEGILPAADRSRLLPLWRIAGFVTGAVPALFGPDAVYATVDSVETFVDRHYDAQVARLRAEGQHPDILDVLARCQVDEIHHRDEARVAQTDAPGVAVRAWCWMVAAGSAAAVAAARRV